MHSEHTAWLEPLRNRMKEKWDAHTSTLAQVERPQTNTVTVEIDQRPGITDCIAFRVHPLVPIEPYQPQSPWLKVL